MSARDGERATEAVATALGRLGLRGVLARGWGGLPGRGTRDTPHLCVVDAAPHGWLFDRVRAVVHHGGAGTTAAALRAGRVSVVVPFDYDQHFWGRLLAGRGLGPEPLPREQLGAPGLERALRSAMETRAYGERIASIAAALQREDGVRDAVRVLEGLGA
jgi:sterol 3beta-glucosyltransferase